MVLLAAGSLRHQHYVSIWGIEDLRGIAVGDDFVSIGAASTFSDIQRHALLGAEFPLLCQAAAETGGIANQNRGTIGGNIANASPAADTPPALLAYDADIELISLRGRRSVPYQRFHTGYKQMDVAADELIAAVRLPRRAGWTGFYRKVGARRAQAIAKVCVAGAARTEDGVVADVRLAFASVSPTVIRATAAEDVIRNAPPANETIEAAKAALASDLAPIDDIRSTSRYRSRVAENLLHEFLIACSAVKP